MELTELRRIKNTGKLPGFANGFPDWQPTPQFYGTTARSIFDPTTLSAEMPTVKDLGIPSSGTVMPLKVTPDQAKLITGDTSTGHNFDNLLQPKGEQENPNGGDSAKGIGPWFALGSWAGGGIASGLNAVKKTNELLAEVGTSNANVGGIGYSAQNQIDSSKYMDEYDSGTAKSFLTNPFEGIARIFGRNKQEQAIKQANQRVAINNTFNRDAALTQKLQMDEAYKNTNSQTQLRGYQDGRGSDYTGGFARLSNGEVLVKGDQIIDRIPGLPNFKDGVTAYVGDAGVVSNHKVGGIRNSDYVMATGDVQGGLMRDMFWRKQHGKGYKNGKLPEFAEGYLGNLIPSGLGMLASIGQYIDASSQDIRSPQIYSADPYEQSALNDLSGLRINQYPIINQINNATARADQALNMSGGLSGYQRARLRNANLLNTQKSISDSLIGAQTQNNAYKANLANAKMQLGNQYAQRMQQSRMFNEEMLAKAHAARQQGKQMGIYNFLNQLQSFYANEFKRRQFNDTMDLYRQNLQLDRDKFNRDLKNYNDIVGVPGMPTPRLYTPSMPLTTGKRPSSNLTPTALWTPANSQYILSGSQPYDDYNIWNLKRRGIIK